MHDQSSVEMDKGSTPFVNHILLDSTAANASYLMADGHVKWLPSNQVAGGRNARERPAALSASIKGPTPKAPRFTFILLHSVLSRYPIVVRQPTERFSPGAWMNCPGMPTGEFMSQRLSILLLLIAIALSRFSVSPAAAQTQWTTTESNAGGVLVSVSFAGDLSDGRVD